jgi:PBSX family phage terminase large subunit
VKTNVLEASLFSPLPADLKQNLLRSGVVPVNDVFIPLWDSVHKINLLYGSYGSGKSVFIVDKLLKKCTDNHYFRCYFGRKVLDTVRGTVHKTFIDRIKERNLSHLFDFSDKPNGSMHIVCKENGNEFIPFGANDASSLKSIKDPTDFFCEEFDQFTFEDFGFMYSRLRTEKAETELYAAFNTDKIYQSHWIRKTFFEGEFANQAYKLKANFTHNYFIDQDDYLEKLRLISGGNSAVLNAIAFGEWGMVRTGDEFWKQFDETKHVREIKYEALTPVHVSLDENVNPYVTQTIWQVHVDRKEINQVHEIMSRSPNNNAPKAARQFAEWLQKLNYRNVVYVYGDPSAGRQSTVDANSASFYDKYIEVLTRAGFRVEKRVAKSAPEVALSAAFVNDIYETNLYGWAIGISDKCYTSIEDYLLVKEDAEGRMLKKKTKDKESGVTYEPLGHCSDTKRYFITKVLATDFDRYKKRSTKNLSNYF